MDFITYLVEEAWTIIPILLISITFLIVLNKLLDDD